MNRKSFEASLAIILTWVAAWIAGAVIVAVLFGAGTVHADDSVTVLVGSQHFVKGPNPYNQTNPGVFVAHTIANSYRVAAVAGAYKNSLSRTSLIAGLSIETPDLRAGRAYARAGVVGGLLTGYYLPVPVGAAPYVEAGYGSVGVRVYALPVYDTTNGLEGVALGFAGSIHW